MTSPAVPAKRRAELAANLAAVEERLGKACAAAGRDRSELTLIVVTKTWPAADVRLLAGLGVRDVGESRDQEARDKARRCADLGLRWHFVGQLQTNKARSVADYAETVHSVDRPALVGALSRGAAAAGRTLTCLVQVDLRDAEPDAGPAPSAGARGGALPAEVPALATTVAEAPGLRLGGVMAVAPRGGDPGAAFAFLVALGRTLRGAHPDADVVSAGMSGDLQQAVAAGATHVRVGSAILGARPPTE